MLNLFQHPLSDDMGPETSSGRHD